MDYLLSGRLLAKVDPVDPCHGGRARFSTN